MTDSLSNPLADARNVVASDHATSPSSAGFGGWTAVHARPSAASPHGTSLAAVAVREPSAAARVRRGASVAGSSGVPREQPSLFEADPSAPRLGADGPVRFDLAQLDAVEWLSQLASASVDLIVTDPPYESLEKHRAIGTTTRLKHSKASSNDWFQIFPNARLPELFREAHRVLKKDRHFYLFCDQETMFHAKPAAEAVGFKFWKPLVWDKQRIGMGYHYRSRYELVLFFEKGKRKLNDLGIADILSFPRIAKGYPTEKPAELASVLVQQSTTQGELVVDPFCGSGSTGVAALGLGRHFLGSDISPQALALSAERLTAAGGLHTEGLMSWASG
ncbi:MAG: site-specific DNA-methyltransferase [Polyangiaceae bacterium]|nr:site-specific DNA-methyltransferase [Polyangiaceae bacterium]MCW5789431.1 site-specific DNA-methyltransferase [Polyangiaceae bacterium]